jgi:hypothetical protein
MSEKKTMRDYIMGNQERTAPKRKTIGEHIIEAKLEALIRQLEILTNKVKNETPCERCGLVGHESQECPTRNLWDDCEIVHSGEQHNPHPPNWDINYIPPCLRRWSQMPMEEPNINKTRTTLKQSTMYDFYQRLQDSISTHIESKQEKEGENITPTSSVKLDEELGHEVLVSIESEEALTKESNYEEKDLMDQDNKESLKSPIILGQTLLTMGDVVIEVHKGKDPSIMVDVMDEAIESICAFFRHNQLGREWTPHHLYQKFMEFLPNQRKQKDDVVSISFWPP